MKRVLVARLDSAGDVLLAGPAVRAIASAGSAATLASAGSAATLASAGSAATLASAGSVTMLVGPRGAAAARLLPDVDQVEVWHAPWVGIPSPPVRADDVDQLIDRLRAGAFEEAVILTSWHQSPLPLALLLRLAGIPHISAISRDHPGSLLDVRHRVPPGLAEVERNLSLARAAGHVLPPGDDAALRVREPLPDVSGLLGRDRFVVVHPGAAVPSRRWPVERWKDTVGRLRGAGVDVVVTGGAEERALTSAVSLGGAVDLGGRTTLAQLAAVQRLATCVVVGNTGPAHLAAAVGTPVVSLFSCSVPASAWAPYRVRQVRLGGSAPRCADSGVRECLTPGHPCLGVITPQAVVDAVSRLTAVAA